MVFFIVISRQDWWQVFDSHYQFNSIFFGHTDGTGWAKNFLNHILDNPAWAVVYLDQHVIILVKDNQINQSLIAQFGLPVAQAKSQINQYRAQSIKTDPQVQAQRLNGLMYLRQNFGNIGSL